MNPGPSVAGDPQEDTTPHVIFVCTGNICRSPMAEKLLQQYLKNTQIRVHSAGTSSWHVGDPMDTRAAQVLSTRACDTNHIARRVSNRDLDSGLIVALALEHRAKLLEKGAPPDRVRLLAEFHPELDANFSIPDPVSGTLRDFEMVADLISDSLPQLAREIEPLWRQA